MSVYTDFGGKHSKVKVKSAKLYEEYETYYLSIHYIIDDETEKRELFIPKVRLPIDAPIDIKCEVESDIPDPRFIPSCSFREMVTPNYLKLVDGTELALKCAPAKEFPKDLCPSGFAEYVCKVIETKQKEMTLDEIEKKLGYKIKIVNK